MTTNTLPLLNQPVITTETIENTRTALSYYFQIEAELPKTGAKIVIQTLPTKLTRDQSKKAWGQLDEALQKINEIRLASPKISFYCSDGTLLRSTELWETIERTSYLAKEGRPDKDMAPIQHWFLYIVKDYGRKRTL